MKTTQDRYPQILRNAYWLHVVAEVWADFRQLPDEINVSHAAPLLVRRSKSVKEQCNIHRSNDFGESALQEWVPLVQPISTAQDCAKKEKTIICAYHFCTTCTLLNSPEPGIVNYPWKNPEDHVKNSRFLPFTWQNLKKMVGKSNNSRPFVWEVYKICGTILFEATHFL